MTKRIILTGTSRGIGLELAKQLSDQGHQILALSRQNSDLKLLNLKGVHALNFDLSETSDLRQVMEFIEMNWNGVDVLIHNAGAICNKTIHGNNNRRFFVGVSNKCFWRS